MKNRLVVMLKVPQAGRVKRRLGADIGLPEAAWWYRHQTARLLRRMRDPRWQTILAVAPDTALRFRGWPSDLRRIGQGQGDIGQRMARVFQSMPRGRTLIIGSDIPGIETFHIAEAFRKLACNDAVIGPALDGGYWLFGLKPPVPARLFEQTRWSTEHAMADTLRNLGGRRIGYAAMLRDVDTVQDLKSA